MSAGEEWYVRCSDGNVYGPASLSMLVEWAEEGRIEPSGHLSKDGESWIPARSMPELGMSWIVETSPGELYGPYNRKMVSGLVSSGQLPADAVIYRRHDCGIDEDPPPVVVEVEKTEHLPACVPAEQAVSLQGMFAGSGLGGLAALEAAAQRELAALKQADSSFFRRLFPRRR